MPAPIVFFDIAGPDTAQLKPFYQQLFDWDIGDDGRFSAPVIAASLDATIRQDPTDKVIYMGVPDVSATLEQAAPLGGTVIAHRFEVPGVVILGLLADPAGNTVGLVEIVGSELKIP